MIDTLLTVSGQVSVLQVHTYNKFHTDVIIWLYIKNIVYLCQKSNQEENEVRFKP